MVGVKKDNALLWRQVVQLKEQHDAIAAQVVELKDQASKTR